MTDEQIQATAEEERTISESKAIGGHARARALSPEQRKEISRMGGYARRAKLEGVPQSIYTGMLTIGDMSFPCSVLSDGTRILTQSDFMTGMGMYYSGWVAKNRSAEDAAADMPHFLSFKSIKPFVDRHLGDLQSIIVKYRTERGNLAHGIKAEIIPKICDVWIDADEQGKLGSRQKQIARKSHILMRALAHVGIIALVDEATGYQRERDRDALQEIVSRYIRKELAAWIQRFPEEFYEQIYRLKGWEWKGMSKNRYSVVGKYTIDLVYERLTPEVLEELERKNPKNEKGRRKSKHHQWLTEDVGIPALSQHIFALTTMARAHTNWGRFYDMVERALPKRGGNFWLPFPDLPMAK